MQPKDHRLAAVMFTDIVGFSRMMEEDEKGTLRTLDFHNQLVREEVQKNRGSEIKTIGDAFLVQFPTTLDAVQCALLIQEGIRKYNEAATGKRLELRIGVHVGDIYFYENDALGEGINIASRLQSATKPGRITISREVYSQVSGKIPMRVESLGQVQLKNISREIHAYEIIPGGEDNNSPAFQSRPAETRPDPNPRTSDFEPTGSSRDLKDVMKEAVLNEVKRKLGNSASWRDVRRQARSQYREKYRHDDRAFFEDFGGESGSSPKAADDPASTPFQRYKLKTLRGAEAGRQGLRGHFSSFLSVNAGLFLVNWFTGQPLSWHNAWFLFPVLGWGIGFLSHRAGVVSARRNARELETMDELDSDSLEVLKRFQKDRTGLAEHFWSNTGVSLLLGWIWYFAGGGFPWPLIPIAAMLVGVVGHVNSFLGRRGAWLSLKKGRSPKNSRSERPLASSTAEDPLVAKARDLKDSILTQARGMKDGNPFGEDMNLTLENYVKQIAELSTIEKEIGRVVASFRVGDLDKEEALLKEKARKSESGTLREEYAKSLAEIEKQKRSFADLGEQQEILALRIGSAMKSLQQMQIDLARIKSLSDGQGQSYFLSLKDRSEELSRYLEDYRAGLEEFSRVKGP